MNALKLLELLLLPLFASLSAEGKNGAIVTENAACDQPESEEEIVVGLYFLTDNSFLQCTPYKDDHTLHDYLSAFAGAVSMRFEEVNSPTVKVVYAGSRPLTQTEEQKIIGHRNTANSAIKGVDAFSEILSIALDDIDSYTMYYVLTWLNITEEKSKPVINENAAISDISSSSESDETGLEVETRSASSKSVYPNVGGLTRYGTLCALGAAAIGQDDGKSFSGVETAAQQVAIALGRMYNGSIARRTCSEYDDDDGSEFHREECYNMKNKPDDEFDCEKDNVKAAMSSVKTPSEFFAKHNGWTPCSTSYVGSQQCTEEVTEECKMKCCLSPNLFNFSTILISAPDGTTCKSDQVCFRGNCTRMRIIKS